MTGCFSSWLAVFRQGWRLFVMAGRSSSWPDVLRRGRTFFVMAGLGPAIHDFCWREGKSWIPGPRPVMTMGIERS
jgi:hypothetical protein